jgi:transcriptional regulator with XRE-family HTH domain
MTDSASNPVPAQLQLGQLLREIRQRNRYSIGDVAEQTGISSSFLSLVETGKSDISVGRLIRLSEFYRVPLGELFPVENTDEITVTRRSTPVTIPSFAEGVTLELLATGDKSELTTFAAEYAPGATMTGPTLHDGEAFVYVLTGKLSVRLENSAEPVILNAGDSAYLHTRTRRTYENVGRGPATLLGLLLRAEDGSYSARPAGGGLPHGINA